MWTVNWQVTACYAAETEQSERERDPRPHRPDIALHKISRSQNQSAIDDLQSANQSAMRVADDAYAEVAPSLAALDHFAKGSSSDLEFRKLTEWQRFKVHERARIHPPKSNSKR